MLMRKIAFKIPQEYDGAEIRRFLRDFGVSASLLTRLKQTDNGITKNGSFALAKDTVKAGDEVVITIMPKGKMPEPRDMDIEVVYEDEDVIVLNKPPFLPVHESRNHIGDTLSNFVASRMTEDTAFRAVFRLDRDTSGLVLVAKHELSASKLAGKINKDYYAICEGIIEDDGIIDLPIARCGDSIIKRKVDESGERAVTHYYPVSHNNGNTLVRFKLVTGRTHQIRVHMSHIGHPLLGDTLYDGDDSRINRQALHCKDIYFVHPITNEDMHITSDFPLDMKGAL